MKRLLMPLFYLAIVGWLYVVYGWPGLIVALAILVIGGAIVALALTFRDRRRLAPAPPFGRQFATNFGKAVTELPSYFS